MAEEARRCGAKTRKGTPCRQWAVTGGERCRMHGGRQPPGLAHPLTKTGRFSQDLPMRMLANYQEALADPDVLAMHEELAVPQARISDLLARVVTGESGAPWRGIRQGLADVRRATQRQDTAAAAAALREMGRLADLGVADYRAWQEVLTAIELYRRLVDTERRRLEAAQQMITTERAMLLVAALVDAVRRHVDDRGVLDAIGREVERIIAVERAAGMESRSRGLAIASWRLPQCDGGVAVTCTLDPLSRYADAALIIRVQRTVNIWGRVHGSPVG